MVGIDITGQNFLMNTAISHIASQNPRKRLPIRGCSMALMAPSMQGMRAEVDPSKMTDKTKVIIEKVGNRPIMKIKYGWKPLNQRTATTVRTSIVGVTGIAPTQGVEATIAYDMYSQSQAVEQAPLDQIQSASLNEYYTKFMNREIDLPQLIAGVQGTSFGNFASTVWETAMNGIFPAESTALATKLFTGVGTNPAFPAVVLPTAAAPIVELSGFQTQGGQLVIDPALTLGLQLMKNKAKTSGRPVLVGGDKWLKWHDLQEVMAINHTIGADQTQYVKRLDHDFYYDENADTIFGADVAVWIEPDSVCQVPYTYYGMGLLPDDQTFNDVYFSEIQASLEQYMPTSGMGYNKNDQNLSMSFDLRIAKKLDSGDFPAFTYQLNKCNGLWMRPTNFFTTDVANPLKTYTGICAVKITG